MKTTITIVSAIWVLFTLSCQKKETDLSASSSQNSLPHEPIAESILGSWRLVSDSVDVVITFSEEGKVGMQVDEDTTKGVYTLDVSTEPWKIDILWQEGWQLLTILRILNSDEFQIEENDRGKPRPVEFSDNADVYRREK